MMLTSRMRIVFASSYDAESQIEVLVTGTQWRNLAELLNSTSNERKREQLLNAVRAELVKASRSMSASGDVDDLFVLTQSFGVRVGPKLEDEDEDRHWKPFPYASH